MGEMVIIAVCNMFLPLTMLGLGLVVWKTRPPFGDLLGYRTTQSLKSPEAWALAQALFGKGCTLTYAVLCALTLIAGFVPIIFKLDDALGIITMIVNLVDFLALFVVIFATERKVKKLCGDDGKNS